MVAYDSQIKLCKGILAFFNEGLPVDVDHVEATLLKAQNYHKNVEQSSQQSTAQKNQPVAFKSF